jgi:uncharacterized integral membrane protein
MRRKGQGYLGYIMLLLVVSGALIAMNVYIRRAVNARKAGMSGEVYSHAAER